MLKKFISIRWILSLLLLLSIAFAGYSVYYKTRYWGFNLTPKKLTDIWTVEAHISFEPNGDPIKVSLATPAENDNFKIMEQDVIAENYKVRKVKTDANRIILTSPAKEEMQNIYYRVMLFDNHGESGKIKAPTPKTPQEPTLNEQQLATAKKLLKTAKTMPGNEVQQIINLFNQPLPDANVLAFLPVKKSPQDTANAIKTLLSLKKIPNRISRGIKLIEDKKSFSADLMIEAYSNKKWRTYNIQDASKGIPSNFILFQRGGDSLIDVEGGEDSVIKFSVIKSVTPSLSLARQRAKVANQKTMFDYSIYSLPIAEQNTIKWLMVFPLAILVIVVMRNVIGIQTMGTFTPMLLSMSLVKTGFLPGLLCFGLIIGVGLIIRAILSKLNLLLVPRISAVVIFVILIMQTFTIFGYRLHVDVAASAVFFPIIIMAWIIERASITWEEDGPINASKEVFNSLIVAMITYFVISNETVRHIVFAFNELNLVILLVVMLLGTYTGYRLTELKRFSPLAIRN